MAPAAIYARSSRDRADVSIATQIHELTVIAKVRGLEIVETFRDAVESGATEDRPGFLKLGDAIKNRDRRWSILLVYDTSRIARRRYIAQAFKHVCRKHGVTIQYAKLPADIDPISELVLDAVFEAMDEVQSRVAGDKAVAGQKENVRRGWRAGGRPPIGYQLEHIETGTVREGKPVRKSRLILAENAEQVARYLKVRARGMTRQQALDQVDLRIAKSSLVGLEWNALVYAGHTVWNRHLGRRARGNGQAKRKSRDQWTVQRDTHKALITDAEAEAILARLSNSTIGEAVSRGKRAASEALLVGFLVTPEGRFWRAAGTHYRLDGKPGRHVRRDRLEKQVVDQIAADVSTEAFITGMVKAAGKLKRTDTTLQSRRELSKLMKERDRAARLALQNSRGPWLALVAERSAQVEALQGEIERAGQEAGLSEAVRQLTPAALRDIIRSIDDPARLLRSLVERVVLGRDLVGRIEYRAALAPSRRVSVASPRQALRFATVAGAWFRAA